MPRLNPCSKHQDGPFHDCDYVSARQLLIGAASQAADRKVGRLNRSSPAWSTEFHTAMTELARSCGLTA